MIPQVGCYFFDGMGNLSVMLDNQYYQPLKWKHPLIYVEESKQFSCDRVATISDMQVFNLNLIRSKNMIDTEFTVRLVHGHDTTKGLQQLEKEYIEHVYKTSRYNQSKAAKNLGLSRGCLRMKLKEYFGDQYL